MKGIIWKLAAGAAALTAASSASAVTLVNFDDIPSQFDVANGYQGVNWDNLVALSPGSAASGYKNGLVSGGRVAYNALGRAAGISTIGDYFNLTDAYFTAAWRDGLQVSATGFVGGVATFQKSFTLGTATPTLVTFDWRNLSSVRFVTSGGTKNPAFASVADGTQFALDNVRLYAAVPEPMSWAMMAGGFGLLGAGMRRRRTAITA